MDAGFARVHKWANQIERELDGSAAKARTRRVGFVLQREVDAAVRRDLGDQSMSGWPRGNPLRISGRSKVLSPTDVLIGARRGAGGPMRVLQSGRNMGQTGAVLGPGANRTSGLTARTKAGNVRKVRATKGRRWNGYTAPKRTWSKAESEIGNKAPGVVHDVFVIEPLRRAVRKG